MGDDEPDYGDIPRDANGEQWLTLEAAIKQIIGLPRLNALFDWARQPGPITGYNFQREQKATLAPLFQLLAEAKMVIKVRPWSQVGGPMRRLRPDEVSQLTIDLFAKSPSLHGPDGERLYALLSSAGNESRIPLEKSPEEPINEMPSPKPAKRWRDKPSQADIGAVVRDLETEYGPGAHPAEREILERVRALLPEVIRDQVRVALKDSPLKGRPGYKSKKA